MAVRVYSNISDYAEDANLTADDDVAQLVSAAARSAASIAEVKSFIKAEFPGKRGLDIVAFGSLARQEWTDQSDFDFLVLLHSLDAGVEAIRESVKVADGARDKLAAGLPGATGMFGTVVSAGELIARIGLETDTNQTLSRRLLVLEESVSLYNEVEHEKLIDDVLGRYLIEYWERPKHGVARFLLNDVVRHWRTVAVDYQAKNWHRVGESGWGLRYLKLRISRKLAFAGTLAPLLLLANQNENLTAQEVHRLLRPPPLARLASLHPFLHTDGRVALAKAVRIAGRFNRQLNSEEFRSDAAAIQGPDGQRTVDFQAALEDSSQLQGYLSEIFLGVESPFRYNSEKYLVF